MSGKVSSLEREPNKLTEAQKELQDLIKETSVKQYKLRDDGFDVSLIPIDGPCAFNLYILEDSPGIGIVTMFAAP